MPSDSIATCLQDGATNSQFNSTEVIAADTSLDTLPTTEAAAAGDSTGTSHYAGGPPKVTMRTKRRNSERPWSVSCLSQLTQTEATTQRDKEQIAANQGLANHSISESALHTLSSPSAIVGNASVSTSATAVNHHSLSMKSVDSKNSLKRRRMRARKRLMVSYLAKNVNSSYNPSFHYQGRKSESGSNGSEDNNAAGNNVQELSRIITSTLTKSESFSGQTNLAEDLSMALSLLSLPRTKNRPVTAATASTSEMDSEEENVMMKPNFRLGAYTTSYGGASKLGSLAALATYNGEKEGKLPDCFTAFYIVYVMHTL